MRISRDPYRPIAEVHAEFWKNIWDLKPHTCPVCHNRTRIYRWSLYATAIKTLIRILELGGDQRFVPNHEFSVGRLRAKGDQARLRHWGLIEEEIDVRRDDGGKAGRWRITDLGMEFLMGDASLPKNVFIFNAKKIGQDDSIKITVHDALKTHFNYREHMR